MSFEKLKKLLFIYNPHAGKEQIKAHLSDILTVFTENGFEVVIHPTCGKDDARELTAHFRGKYDLLVVAGGDGTLEEVCAGMLSRRKKIPIGYIPAGSTNDFGKSLGIPKNPVKAAKVAINGKAFACDMGAFNGDRIFVYVAAFGLFTDVSYETPQSLKHVFGHAAYVLEGAKSLANIPSYRMRITCDDQVVKGNFIYGMASNSRSVGGFPVLLNKQITEFDDGMFEVTLVRRPRSLAALQNLLLGVVEKDFKSKYILTLRGKQIKFETIGPIPWTVDGEPAGTHTCVEVENLPRALELMI